jgi:hypothetical protein
MPLQARQDFPSAKLQLQELTSESQLRDFLLSRRLERGIVFLFLFLFCEREPAEGLPSLKTH